MKSHRLPKLAVMFSTVAALACLGAGVAGAGGGIGGAWGHHHDPQKHLDHMTERLRAKLSLRPDQNAALDALKQKISARMQARHQAMQAGAGALKAEIDKPSPNVDTIVQLLKQKARERPSVEELDATIDDVAVFYRSLDHTQQAAFNDMMRERFAWFD